MKKVGVFIDVQNIYLTTKANFGDGKSISLACASSSFRTETQK